MIPLKSFRNAERLLRIDKPWGHEEILLRDNNTTHKLIYIKPGKKLSLQMHVDKKEFMELKKGVAFIDYVFFRENSTTLQSTELILNEKYFVPAKCIHRLRADSTGAIVEEISFGSDEDIVRFYDDYNRL